MLYCTNHGGRQANSNFPTLELLFSVVAAAGSTPVMFDSGARDATDAVIGSRRVLRAAFTLARGATAVGIGRPHPYALSYGGAEP